MLQPHQSRGWFRDIAFVIRGGGFSWHFSRPLKKDGEHDQERRKRQNCMKSAEKRSVFLCYAVKTLEISVFCR